MKPVTVWHPGIILPPEKLTPAIIAAIRATLYPPQVVGLTAWAEARSRYEPGQGWLPNPIDAMADVANVISNRVLDSRWKHLGYAGVCYQPWQFSCWTPTDGAENFEALMQRAQFLIAGKTPSTKLDACIHVADAFIAGRHENLLGPAVCHYISDWLEPWPAWAHGRTPVFHRYGHVFFANVV